MKKLEIIIKAERLEDVKSVLEKNEINGMNITNIMGYGAQKGMVKAYRGNEYNVNLLPKIKVETVVEDDIVEKLIDEVTDAIHTGNIGDGKIFIYDVLDAVRIRTGERGKDAL